MADRPQDSLFDEDGRGDLSGEVQGWAASAEPPEDAKPAGWRESPVADDQERTRRGGSDIAVASAKVAAIVEAAERAAEDLRVKTEERARARIAEADRAADLRVEAAEAEARDIVNAATREAAVLTAQAQESVRQIHTAAARTRDEAERRKLDAVREAQEEATRIRAEADAYADDVKRKAKMDAREILAEAHDAARGVLRDGTELSGHLQELSDSLRKNAARLLNDVRLAHGRLTADLDQATPAGLEAPARGTHPGDGTPQQARQHSSELEVPEFIPPRP